MYTDPQILLCCLLIHCRVRCYQLAIYLEHYVVLLYKQANKIAIGYKSLLYIRILYTILYLHIILYIQSVALSIHDLLC